MTVTATQAGPWGPTQMPKEQPTKATGWVMPAYHDDPSDDEGEHIFSSTTNHPPHLPGQPDGSGEDPMLLATMQTAGYLYLEGNPPD